MMGLWSDGCQKFEIFWGFRTGVVYSSDTMRSVTMQSNKGFVQYT